MNFAEKIEKNDLVATTELATDLMLFERLYSAESNLRIARRGGISTCRESEEEESSALEGDPRLPLVCGMVAWWLDSGTFSQLEISSRPGGAREAAKQSWSFFWPRDPVPMRAMGVRVLIFRPSRRLGHRGLPAHRRLGAAASERASPPPQPRWRPEARPAVARRKGVAGSTDGNRACTSMR